MEEEEERSPRRENGLSSGFCLKSVQGRLREGPQALKLLLYPPVSRNQRKVWEFSTTRWKNENVQGKRQHDALALEASFFFPRQVKRRNLSLHNYVEMRWQWDELRGETSDGKSYQLRLATERARGRGGREESVRSPFNRIPLLPSSVSLLRVPRFISRESEGIQVHDRLTSFPLCSVELSPLWARFQRQHPSVSRGRGFAVHTHR